MQSDLTKRGTSTAYLVTDESCSARVGGRHDSAASALFPPIAQKRRNPPPLSPWLRGGGGREGGALSLSASQLTLLRCLNSHFLYKIDALTAALVCTRLYTGTVDFFTYKPASTPLLSSSESPHPPPPPNPHSSNLMYPSPASQPLQVSPYVSLVSTLPLKGTKKVTLNQFHKQVVLVFILTLRRIMFYWAHIELL